MESSCSRQYVTEVVRSSAGEEAHRSPQNGAAALNAGPRTTRRTRLHVDEEAGGHLRLEGARVEERRARVREVLLGHEVVRLDGGRDVRLVDADRHAHQHVLRPLDDLPVDLEQVGALQSLRGRPGSVSWGEAAGGGGQGSRGGDLEAEIVVVVVAVINNI